MKNLLTYISPSKDFNEEHKKLVKIQIDNSLSLGWERKDILLVTNFEYEYNSIKAKVIGDDNYCKFFFPATKIYTIVHLFEKELIENDLYWFHDFDSFQLEPFDKPIIDNADMGLSNYGRMPRLCSASMFFKNTAGDIFKNLKIEIDKRLLGEEDCIMKLINSNESYQKRVERLNITYAFHKFNLWHCYNRADKPIKVVHFHITPDKYDFYVKGNNPMKKVLIPERLIKIFNENNFKYE
jgi:hypothetical protein